MIVLAQNANLRASSHITDDPQARLRSMIHQEQRSCELVIISIQTALSLMRGKLGGEAGANRARLALQHLSVAETILHQDTAKGHKLCQGLTAFCRLLHSVVRARQGSVREALRISTEAIQELRLHANPKLHSVFLLNICAYLAQLERHREVLETANAVCIILLKFRAKLKTVVKPSSRHLHALGEARRRKQEPQEELQPSQNGIWSCAFCGLEGGSHGLRSVSLNVFLALAHVHVSRAHSKLASSSEARACAQRALSLNQNTPASFKKLWIAGFAGEREFGETREHVISRDFGIEEAAIMLLQSC